MSGYANPQSLNRYSYTLNNPLRYTDPTGHKPCGDGELWDCNGYAQDPNKNPHPPQPPKPDPDEDENSGGGDKPLPSPDLNANDDNVECPDWSTCVINVPGGAIQNYWDTNNGFLNTMNGTLLGMDLVGLGGAALAYLTGIEVISAESVALILGISLLDPSPIEEIIIVGGLVVAATAITANLAVNDIQNVNNALVASGALQNGGSIVVNWDSVTITTSQGTTSVNTVVPFAAQISLST